MVMILEILGLWPILKTQRPTVSKKQGAWESTIGKLSAYSGHSELVHNRELRDGKLWIQLRKTYHIKTF